MDYEQKLNATPRPNQPMTYSYTQFSLFSPNTENLDEGRATQQKEPAVSKWNRSPTITYSEQRSDKNK